MSTTLSKCIIGAGGLARDVLADYVCMYGKELPMYVHPEYVTKDTYNLQELNFDKHEVIVAVGNPVDRKRIVESLPFGTKFWTFVSNKAFVMGNVHIGQGSIICAGTILTQNIYIGEHTHLNLLSTIGHDTYVGNYFTAAPGAKISGNCSIKECVYVGTNSSVREKISICSNVTIGLNSGVVKNITQSGVYGGAPAKLIKQ